jgi:two-component system NtrC family sensor kinase
VKKMLFFFIFLVTIVKAYTQPKNILKRELSITDFSNLDSLENELAHVKNDTLKSIILGDLSFGYAFSEAEKGLTYGRQGLELSQTIGYANGTAYNNHALGTVLWSLGSYDNSIRYSMDALRQYELLADDEKIARTLTILSIVNRDVGDYENALLYSHKAAEYLDRAGYSRRIQYANLGSIHELRNSLDSAYYYTKKAHEIDLEINGGKWDWLYWILGNIHAKRHNYPAAIALYRHALALGLKTNIYKSIVEAHNGIAHVYLETGNPDSCIYYASEVLQKWQFVSYQKGVMLACKMLADAYKLKNTPDSAIKYLELSNELNDRLFNQQQLRNIQILAFNEQKRLESIKREEQEFRNKLKIYGLLAVGIFLVAIALLLWRNIMHRKTAYKQLQMQKAETESQKLRAESAYNDLQATQKQLIQSAKMASLGELTAGIAHEIQNPLNFVNNFSDVNKELTIELEEELRKGNIEDVIVIARDIRDNEDKINYHGKRADAIVKNMLQHSRTSGGVKESTNINSLADEYLRLAYHGFRAKDKSFNAILITEFDDSLGNINIVAQDIGRVLLNLYNNALYAVAEKKKANADFTPEITVTTIKIDNTVEIHIKDNGNGIAEEIRNKIFQPFFTTKPTGEGTGLGLSLAYDIVKAHNGEIKVVSTVGDGAEFSVMLTIAP